MQCNKFYIMAMAASGKSTFASKNPEYNGYQVTDFASRLPSLLWSTRIVLYFSRLVKPLEKLVAKRPDRVARYQKNYFRMAFEYLVNHDKPVVVLGRRTPDDFENLPVHDSVKFAMVLIPEENHRRNCATRKRELRNPLPFFHHWTTDFKKISKTRAQLSSYAQLHGIAVYDGFGDAIDDMHKRFNSG